jgi:Spy/CpxP family protein refolding chaperone
VVFLGTAAGSDAGAAMPAWLSVDRAVAVAQSPHTKLIVGQIGRTMVLYADLDITADQIAKIREVVMKRKFEFVVQGLLLVTRKALLIDAVMAEKVDEKAIRAAADNLGQSIGNLAVATAKTRSEIASILTSDQKEAIAAYVNGTKSALFKYWRRVNAP